jgi:NAD(P)-dependent dehydrogenase (short-subunit alcohol dehydrogenase family)
MRYIEHADVDRAALRGSVAVVTGAGQGIGRETARLFAALGASVVIAELNETAGRDSERLILDEGGSALFVRTDVADPASMERLHQRSLTTFGDVDILVNNAEAFTCKPVLDNTVSEWDRVFAVNLRGAFLDIKAFLPTMLQRGRGVVLTMQSADGMPYLAPYLATKVGLRSLAFSLAQEVGAEHGVWVYCFGAGMVETPGGVHAFRELAPRYGMTFEEFVRQAAPGGHLIAAELCATGLVGTILHARQFHGQETDYVAGLSLLRLTSDGQRVDSQQREVVEQAHLDPALVREALALNQQMEAIVRANLKECDEQNMFVRPIVKRMFQQGTGLKVEDWLAQAQDMTHQLESLSASGQAEQPALDAQALAAYLASVRRMGDYITKQEADARGWMRDPAQLQLALDTLRQRKATMQQLAAVLAQLQQRGVATSMG